jgi:hypothetical protein
MTKAVTAGLAVFSSSFGFRHFFILRDSVVKNPVLFSLSRQHLRRNHRFWLGNPGCAAIAATLGYDMERRWRISNTQVILESFRKSAHLPGKQKQRPDSHVGKSGRWVLSFDQARLPSTGVAALRLRRAA